MTHAEDGDATVDDHLRQLLIEDLHRARHGYGLAVEFAGEGSEFSPSCGDAVTVRVGPDGFSWEGNGCAVSMAAASALGATSVDDFRMLVDDYLASVAPGAGTVTSIGGATLTEVESVMSSRSAVDVAESL